MFWNQFSQKSPRALHVLNHVGSWRLAAVGGWQLATGGWWRLVVVGGGWWLVIGGWWQLAVVGSWQLVAAGGWRLAVGGWWRLAVGGWWSLGAVLSKKKNWSLKDRPAPPPKCWALLTPPHMEHPTSPIACLTPCGMTGTGPRGMGGGRAASGQAQHL